MTKYHWLRGRRWSAAAMLAIGMLASGGCVSRRDQKLGGRWFIRWETSQLAESGGVHPYLHRRRIFGSRRVEENTWRYRYLGNDCVLYVAGNSNRGELMAACGDRKPVVIAPNMNVLMTEDVADGLWKSDPIIVNGQPITVQEVERLAQMSR
jgi:hypothetical protein